MSDYVPEAGDIVWLNFDSQTGHEQSGHRPALVLSPKRYDGLLPNDFKNKRLCF